MSEPYLAKQDGIRITVRLTPSASADRIEGVARLSDDTAVLAARVRALPEDGRANRALEKLVAKALGVSRGAVTVATGAKARLKQLAVEGDATALLDTARRLWPSRTDSEGGGE